jgi:choice-of-anchor C domain-containing protein
MKTRSILGASAAVVASIVFAGSALAAFTGVTNGSFEAGAYTGGSFNSLSAGSTSLTGWTVTGSIDWTGTFWTAKDGSKSLDLSGVGPGAISQTLATTIGKTYEVSFALSGNPDGAPAAKTLTLSATGGSTTTYTFDTGIAGNNKADMKWSTKTYSFVATSATTVLTFTSTTASAYGPALDSVVVTEKGANGNGTGTGAGGGPGAKCKDGGWRTMSDSHGNRFKNQGDCVSNFATGGKNRGAAKP